MEEKNVTFEEKLNQLLELAKTRKNVLDNKEILNFFHGEILSPEQLDQIYEFLDNHKVDVTRFDEDMDIDPDLFDEDMLSEEEEIDMENIETKPMYDVSFHAEGEVKGIHLSYVDWEKSEMPISAQSTEETARQFVISHQLAAKDSLKVLGSAAASSDTIAVVIQHKEGRALLIGVDSLAGKVRYFEDMTEKSAVKSITPFEEGKGLG